MNDLTEQWKKGDLKSGWYYTRLKEGTFAEGIKPIEINYFYEFNKTFESHNDFVEQVLAKVPTYSEYLALQSDSLAKNEASEIIAELEAKVKDLKHRNENLQLALKTYELPEIQKVLIDWRTGELDKKFNKLGAENTKLKELLKECRSLLSFLQINDYDNNGLLVIGRINQALGEDK